MKEVSRSCPDITTVKLNRDIRPRLVPVTALQAALAGSHFPYCKTTTSSPDKPKTNILRESNIPIGTWMSMAIQALLLAGIISLQTSSCVGEDSRKQGYDYREYYSHLSQLFIFSFLTSCVWYAVVIQFRYIYWCRLPRR